MKGTITAILITLFIVFTCIFISCNSNMNWSTPEDTSSESDATNYSEIINDLKSQLIELKQNQYISDIEREAEIKRLEGLISALETNTEKQTQKPTESAVGSQTESSTVQNDTESETATDTSETESTSAEESTVGKFTYTPVDGGISITGYDGQCEELIIPSSIDGMKVVAISDSAFASMDIKSASVPDSVVKIGWFAFKDCKYLRAITLPKSITSIGYSAFSNAADNLIFICDSDSFAARYAESYGIRYTSL